MRLIDSDVAIKYLGKELHGDAYATAYTAIDKTPTAQQWIPCSERLPEEEGYYLTTTMYQKVYCDYWNGDNFDRTEMVVAWMPLPEPWKGEQP